MSSDGLPTSQPTEVPEMRRVGPKLVRRNGRTVTNPRAYNPTSRRPHRIVNDPALVLKRLRCVRYRIRPILYGTFPNPAPDFKPPHETWRGFTVRDMTWAWRVREFTHKGTFKYQELVKLTQKFVSEHGVSKATDADGDLELFIRWYTMLQDVRRAEKRWRPVNPWAHPTCHGNVYEQMKRAEYRALNLMLSGVCPLCGGKLPCMTDAVPKIRRVRGYNQYEVVTPADGGGS